MSKKNNKVVKDELEIEALKRVREYKLIAESNIVSILWKDPEQYFNYENLSIDMFTHNEWKVYFQIGYDIVVKEKKPVLDEITVGLYLEKHDKLRQKYDEYGGFEKIELAKGYVRENNIDGYVKELNKWNTVIQLAKHKFPIAERLSEYTDMSSEEIYDEYEAILNHIFINVEGDDKTYSIGYKIYDLIDELNEGLAVGLPLHNLPMLTHEIGGNLEGNITLMGGLSGMGKTTFTRSAVIPSIIDNDERIVILANEEGLKKWQRELIIWVANNIYKRDIKKYELRDGGYSSEFITFLKDKCAKWIVEREEQIIFKPLSKFSTNKSIKIIKKYAHLGVKYFVLDTYKSDSGEVSENNWMAMQQNMVNLYDTIKEECANVHLWVTFQLSKSSSKQRCYTQDNIGMAKNIIDVASTCIMVRKLFEDEFEGGKNALKVYKKSGKNGKTNIPVTLDKDKHYQILFVIKNREGGSGEYQIVVEHDMSKNTLKEVGFTIVPADF